MIKWITSLVLLCCLALFKAAASPLPDLTTPDILKGSFIQKKFIKALKRPITSKGEVIITPKRGVLWQTLFPVDSMIRVNVSDVVELKQQGTQYVANKITGSEHFSSYLLAIYQGNWESLRDSFDIIHNTNSNGKCSWNIRLVPKRDNLSLIFKHIDISGNQHIEQIELLDPKDNLTKISLDLRVSHKLSEKEKEYFSL